MPDPPYVSPNDTICLPCLRHRAKLAQQEGCGLVFSIRYCEAQDNLAERTKSFRKYQAVEMPASQLLTRLVALYNHYDAGNTHCLDFQMNDAEHYIKAPKTITMRLSAAGLTTLEIENLAQLHLLCRIAIMRKLEAHQARTSLKLSANDASAIICTFQQFLPVRYPIYNPNTSHLSKPPSPDSKRIF